MGKSAAYFVFSISTAFGMLVIIIDALLVLHGCQSFGGTSIARGEPVTKLAFSPSLSGPSTPMAHQGRALPPGSGSAFGILSLAYASRRLAIDTRQSDIAKPTNDKDVGAGTFDLARGGNYGLEGQRSYSRS